MTFKKIQLLAQIVGFVTIGFLTIFGVLAIASGGSPAWATLGQASPSNSPRVPNVINYQGMLRQADGSPMNGTYPMTFKLYDTPVGGTPDHEEKLSDVVVRDGLFTVLLGNQANNPIKPAAFQGPLYVGIQVKNNAEMQPRQRIAPVPYAIQLTDGVYVDGSGQVGVGTTDPQVQLDVEGDLTVNGDAAVSGAVTAPDVDATNITTSGLDVSGTISVTALAAHGDDLTVKAVREIGYSADPEISPTQRSDYDVSLRRYLVKAESNPSPWSVEVDDDILMRLCGDEDGCTVRLGYGVPKKEQEVLPFHFWVDPETREWVKSHYWVKEREITVGSYKGKDNNRKWEHIWNIYRVCYFTDSEHRAGKNMDDPEAGFALFNYSRKPAGDNYCLLIIDD